MESVVRNCRRQQAKSIEGERNIVALIRGFNLRVENRLPMLLAHGARMILTSGVRHGNQVGAHFLPSICKAHCDK